MSMINGFSAADAERLSAHERSLIERRERLLGPAYRLFYERPLHTVRGEGVWLFDDQGRRYLDAYNNVASVGHCHPRVVSAISRQAAQLNTHTRYLQEGILDYAEQLLGTFPDYLERVMFTLHRQRGQRPCPAHRPPSHRRHRRHHHPLRLPRRHRRPR